MAQKPQQRSAVFGGEKLKHQKSILGVRFDLRCFHHYCCEGFLRFMMLREDLKYVTGCIISLLIYTVYNVTLTFKSTCTCWKKQHFFLHLHFCWTKIRYRIQSHHIQIMICGNFHFWWKLFLENPTEEFFVGSSSRFAFGRFSSSCFRRSGYFRLGKLVGHVFRETWCPQVHLKIPRNVLFSPPENTW